MYKFDTINFSGFRMIPSEFRKFFAGKTTITLARDSESIQACSLHFMSLMNEDWSVVAKTVYMRCSVCTKKIPDSIGRKPPPQGKEELSELIG